MKKHYLLFVVLSVFLMILCCSCSAEDTAVNTEDEIIFPNELDEKRSDELLDSPEYLPIGTVVTVNDGTKKLMIIGLLQVKAEDGEVYDYSAVLYPEGYLGPSETYLFNKEQISRIYHLGYVSQEQEENNKAIEQLASSEEKQ